MAAPHARGKSSVDEIFELNGKADALAREIGPDKVVNATVGSIMDEEGKLVVLDTVKEALKKLTPDEICDYSPVEGYPAFRKDCIEQCFGQSRPEGYIDALATSGGTGVLHHAIHNYSEPGDEVLVTDWRWSAYDALILDNNRRVHEFSYLTEDGHFNISSFEKEVGAILAKQDRLVIILNGVANNPTGYNMSPEEWGACAEVLKKACQSGDKRAILVPDLAYLDYSGPKEESRRFFKVFGNLPRNILVILAYTLSKSFTMYGQRVGAMIGISSDPDVIKEFVDINQYSSQATWSDCTSAAQNAVIHICEDPAQVKKLDEERARYFNLIQERAAIFMKEAPAVHLKVMPYISGFFITIPAAHPREICHELEKENVFMVPLEKGIRLAVCSVPKAKMKGLAAKTAEAVKRTGLGQ